MRGKPCPNCLLAALSRITPARAGKTLIRLRRISTSWDHPRACGENAARRRCPPFSCGSPPRVRGKLDCFPHRRLRSRITPARAGKTRQANRADDASTDHPRACGENQRLDKVQTAEVGSPPRVRGKRRQLHMRRQEIRITPARAGKTSAGAQQERGGADHPRACGENYNFLDNVPAVCGSPPRVRGKQLSTLRDNASMRITPARAGKTYILAALRQIVADHPRACGENNLAYVMLQPPSGSPPRVRGKLHHLHIHVTA